MVSLFSSPQRRAVLGGTVSLLLGCTGNIAGQDDDGQQASSSGVGAEGAGASGGSGGTTGSGGAVSSGGGNSGGAGQGGTGGSLSNPVNPVGIGLVGPGSSGQWDRAAELCGRGGHIKLIFPGITRSMNGPPGEWVSAVSEVYARDLVPVIRMGPPWGDRDIRKESDDPGHQSYTQLAAAYAAVVAALPLRDGWPLVVEVHNEANLCYEWECNPADVPADPNVPAGWIHYTTTASEYAALLRDVASAVHALGEPRIVVTNGGLAPGGTVACECGGSGFTPGITSREFLTAMEAAVPGVHASLDAFASHSYPASGEGYGFFDTYANSTVGLHYFESELSTLGLSLPVYITETGWTVAAGAMGSRQDVANWTVAAWDNDWLGHPAIAAVMPFMLQDPAWDEFAWLDGGGSPYPVFDAVLAWRCGKALPEPCN